MRPTHEKETCKPHISSKLEIQSTLDATMQKTLRLGGKALILVLLTTLLSTLMGPLLILLLLLIIGPCVLNSQVAFIRTRINAV